MRTQRSTGGRHDVAPLEQTFEELVQRHTDVVWRFAYGMLRDAHDAEEVVQDTFVRVHRNLDTWRGEATLRTWIVSICRHLCIDRLRARRADVVSLDEARADRAHLRAAGATADPAERLVVRDAIAAGVAALPEDEREAFHLVDVLGFSGTEAAAIVGVPPTTLRSRLHRAHAALVTHVLHEEDHREL